MASNGSMRNVVVADASGGSQQQASPGYGLIIPAKKGNRAPVVAGTATGKVSFALKMKPAAAVFSRDHDDDDDDGLEDSGGSKKSERARINRDVARIQNAISSNAKVEALHRAAMAEDAHVFDYDGIYDSMKETEELKRKAREMADEEEGGPGGAGKKKKPKYVAGIFAASLARKVYLEQAEEKKVQREREAEGEQFQDKEAFVTEAYKLKQEELRRLEEEEKAREAMEKKGENMAQFYRSLLDSHDRLASSKLTPEEIERAAAERRKREAEAEADRKEMIEHAIRTGEIRVNDSDEVVDKRVLLKGGLNVSRSKLRNIAVEKEEEERAVREAAERRRREAEELAARRREEAQKRRLKEEHARRMAEEAQRQELEEKRKRAERLEEERAAVAAKMAKKATEETVSDARARYLARKAAAASKGGASGGVGGGGVDDDDSD